MTRGAAVNRIPKGITTVSQETKSSSKTRLNFPAGFLWGAATSAYQVEGGIRNNDWAVSKRVPQAGAACDHYRRFEEDFKLAKKLNQNAHRLSLEWSRIEPEKDKWNEQELHHYLHVLEFLKDNGFKTFVTLHHFTSPDWVARQGGWLNKKTMTDFASYVAKVAQSLGQLIDFWVTINEPNIYSVMAYWTGQWPPHEKSLLKTIKAYHHLLDAHNQAYELIHAYYPEAKVGFAQNVTFHEPAHKSFVDRLAAKLAGLFDIDFPYKHTRSDFLGVNHYFHNRLHAFGLAKQRGELSDRGWEIYPRGLYEVLMRLKKYGKPIFITENGIADAKDTKREKYIVRYLNAVSRAITRGADVRGYLHWSLLDSFEWEDGYKWKFGLVEVDFKSKALTRRVRESAKVYARICKENTISF